MVRRMVLINFDLTSLHSQYLARPNSLRNLYVIAIFMHKTRGFRFLDFYSLIFTAYIYVKSKSIFYLVWLLLGSCSAVRLCDHSLIFYLLDPSLKIKFSVILQTHCNCSVRSSQIIKKVGVLILVDHSTT